jgi:hypothetical protein
MGAALRLPLPPSSADMVAAIRRVRARLNPSSDERTISIVSGPDREPDRARVRQMAGGWHMARVMRQDGGGVHGNLANLQTTSLQRM